MRAYLAAMLIVSLLIGSTLIVAIEVQAGGSESGVFPNRTFTVSKGILGKLDKASYTTGIAPAANCTWWIELASLDGSAVRVDVSSGSGKAVTTRSESRLTDPGSESEHIALEGGLAYNVTFSYYGKAGAAVLVERTSGLPIPRIAHAPILITSNADFTFANGVVAGSGVIGDPFVIEGWAIDASSSIGIQIAHADVQFIVRYCEVRNGSAMSYDGIRLSSCSNGILEENTCVGNRVGISLLSSNNIALRNNSCSNNDEGMSLYLSNGNTISNNTCSSDLTHTGIRVGSSNGNTICNNDCSGDFNGIYLSLSSNNILYDNICGSNLGYGLYLDQSSNNTLSENTCCSNVGFGIFLVGSSDCALINNVCGSNGRAGIGIAGSYRTSLSGNTCDANAWSGIYLHWSDGCTLTDNNCIKNTKAGIELYYSNRNNICCNSILWNVGYGLSVSLSSNNRMWNNTLDHNNGASDVYDESHRQARDDGTDNRWNSSDGYGNWWNDWTTPDIDSDGIVDQRYAIDGSAGAEDYYPLVSPPGPGGIVAEAGPTTYVTVPLPETVTLDGSGSHAPSGIVSYVWTWIGGMDPAPMTATGVNPSVPWQWFYYIDNYTVTLTVTDAQGNVAIDTTNVYFSPRLVRQNNAYYVEQWYVDSDGYLKVMIENHGMYCVNWSVMDITDNPQVVYESTMLFSGDGVYVSEPFWMTAGQHIQITYEMNAGPEGAYFFVFGFFVPVA